MAIVFAVKTMAMSEEEHAVSTLEEGWRECSITWGVMEHRPDDRGRRLEVPKVGGAGCRRSKIHYVRSNTILYQFEAAKRPKISYRVMQKLYGPHSKGIQKLYVSG